MPNGKASDKAAVLRISQMQLLYEQWPVGLAATLALAPALVALFWDVTAHRALLVWLVSIVAVTAIRLGMLWAYHRSAPQARQARSWLGWLLAGIAASGSLWGSVIILLVPSGSDLHLGFAALCLCGLSAGSVAAYAPFKSSFFAFAGPALLPGAIYLAAGAKPVELTLSATLFLFFGFVSLNALRVHRTVVRSLHLQFENTELIAQLQAEKTALARSKEELEERVTERTGQLARMNVELQSEVIKGQQHEALVVESEERNRDLYDELSYQATHDDLTDLTNRREFEQRLKRALDSAHSEKREHALCYLDLDQFKVVNDSCGHIAGDELLRQLSALFRNRVRQDRDTLARLGGDEFGVLMENCSLRDALRVAHQLKETVQKYRFMWEGKIFHVGLSMGLIPITRTAGSVTDILKAADAACYAAKDKGRNRIHVYHKDSTDLAKWSREIEWVTRINHALDDNRFHLYCQPIVPLSSSPGEQDLLHYELLVRLEDEQGHIVLPSVFVPAAERYGLNVRLDRWVLEQTLKSLSGEPEHLSRLYICGINISALSVSDEDFLAFVIQQFEHFTVPPQKFCFEITETAVISNIKNATRFIRALKERGCFFALDDFGSGSSSFAYLKRLPVDFLKIDGLFIKDLADDPVIANMVASINDIGHAMGKKTIAEFVASEAVFDKLRQIGVDYAQGSGVGPTRPLGEMIKPRS
ncbi:MAG: EAL domain-containing protein [Gammaproteobacteria bacterium]